MDDMSNTGAGDGAQQADTAILEQHEAALRDAFGRLDINVDELDKANPSSLVAALNGAADRFEEVTKERDKLKAAAQKSATTPKAVPSTKKGRKVAPPRGRDEEPQPVTSEAMEALLEQIGEAETVEVVFSDGAREIDGIPALEVTGDCWKKTQAGLALNGVDVIVHGPGHAQPAYKLAGYGLLLDGKQVAYHARADGELTIGANQQVSLSGDIVF